MKKSFVILLILIAFKVSAQLNYGLSLVYAFPVDDLRKGANNGYGANVQMMYSFDPYVSVGVTTGYISFPNQKSDSKISPLIDGNNLWIVPFLASCKVHIGSTDDRPGASNKEENKLRTYFGLDFGWASGNLKLITGSKNYIMIVPQIGLDYTFTSNMCLRVGINDNVLIYNRLMGAGSDLLSYIGLSGGLITKF